MTPNDFSRKNLINLPNVLTYLRIAAIPVIVVLLAPPTSKQSLNLAFFLYLLASTTDYLDGILARRHNQVTSVGKLLDPLADKLLTSAVLIMLIPLEGVQAWLVFLILGREIIITGLRSIAASRGLILDASPMGKRKMVSQSIAIGFLLLAVRSVETTLHTIGMGFLWISLVLSYWSAGDYFLAFHREVKRTEEQ
ncbi:MAG TPA: CDP-diacylglycerol--glycerol-3-phosphate 3-phosphatidyltransferase [Syntrophobacteraceae bacterium]|jgi:CDP-diacylglycerol---glycerol-3-phosphate 3-phosphatidyltransferase|nr:CDP-diacylglycerol--glycerol-3-phosphate 3-phosphatidyltransferase [Syntrophobacteraceae bacterium]HBD09007.1 CDP-diacylglycerol--glycerol-3-phosphate 3-phosphatidyltransferase [Syntrophobacteraceae bacterium]